MEKFKISTHAIVENGNKILVLQKKSEDAFSADKWFLPGGEMKFGEDTIDSLKRTVKECCGIEIEVLSPIEVSVDVNEEKQEQNVSITYICEYKSGQLTKPKNVKEAKWLEPKKVIDLEELDPVLEKSVYTYNEFISA
ncbi:MAG: NUDIX domain-containing protein [Candidatus Aenigmarchaeota archaeon]|nr:NUDIX domain-containing protein [Candidatus Aenigmarchaeota archaeon]